MTIINLPKFICLNTSLGNKRLVYYSMFIFALFYQTRGVRASTGLCVDVTL